LKPRNFPLYIFILSFVSAGETEIDLSNFPRPTMYTSKRMGEITIDGMVNEAAWMGADSITEFYQSQPNPGYAPTEQTVVRVLYDEDYLYVSAILYDSEPEKIIIESLSRVYVGTLEEYGKAHAWKVCVLSKVPWVRIPLSPPLI